MTVSFFGHREIYEKAEVEKRLAACVLQLLEDGAVECLLGDYGDFDRLCGSVLQKRRNFFPRLRLVYVQPYLDRLPSREIFDEIIYPPLENVPKKYAISKRNEWMIRQSDVVVIYCKTSYGGAAAALSYAKRQGKRIVLI